MSRLDDLIDLVQTTNEVYFITAPGRVRTAYILVDDIVELALKTFLQMKSIEQREQFQAALEADGLVTSRSHRSALDSYCREDIDLAKLTNDLGLKGRRAATLQGHLAALTPIDMLQHWSVNEPDDFKKYYEVVHDVKLFFSGDTAALRMLDEAAERHNVRNKFYHDHKQSGLTIDDDKCLRALCAMFDLLTTLFPDFLDRANKTVRCQIGVLRLKLAAHEGANELSTPYLEALKQIKKDHSYDINQRSVEHSLVHTVSERFFAALREQFDIAVGLAQYRVDVINHMSHRQQKMHRTEKRDKEHLVAILQRQLTIIDSLIN